MPLRGNVGMASYPRTTALLLGCGNSTTPYTDTNTSIADKNFFGYWVKTTATSGTARGNYLRLYLSSGAGGEAARFYTTVENAAPADTCNGAHISLDFGASAGNITGLGTAARCTFHIPNRSLTGTTAAIQAELWSDGASSAIGGTTSFLRVSNGGNATGMGAVDAGGFFLVADGLTAGATNMFTTGLTAATVNAATTASLKCKIGSTTYYIPLATAIV